MSVLHHESLLESCFDQSREEFRVHNQLSVEQMNEMESHEGVQIALRRSAESCLLYTSPSPRDRISSRMPSSA